MSKGAIEAGEAIRSIIQSVADDIAKVRVVTNGIVFVVHTPGRVTRQAMKKLGVRLKKNGTTVFGTSCHDAARAVGHDSVTRRWCEGAPSEQEIKVFLISGDGSALLTLTFDDHGVKVKKEPDIFLVSPQVDDEAGARSPSPTS